MSYDYYTLLWYEKVDKPTPNLLAMDEFFYYQEHNNYGGGIFAWDTENSGLKVWRDPFWCRSMSFANENGSCAVEIRDEHGGIIDLELEKRMWDWLADQEGLICHNFFYDGSVLARATKKLVKPHMDTMGMVGYLGCDGHPGQGFGLKFAAEHLLGWPKYDRPLTDHLFEKLKTKDKGMMCHADWDILGYYGQLDAVATWEVYKRCKAAMEYDTIWGPVMWDMLTTDFITHIMLHIESYRAGVIIDVEAIGLYGTTLDQSINEARAAFYLNDKIRSVIENEWQDHHRAQWEAEEPTKRVTNSGALHGQYVNSLARWKKRGETLIVDNPFSIDSDQHIKFLFSKLFEVEIRGAKAYVYRKCGD